MALSGSFDVSATRTIIVEASLRKLGALAEGQSATTTQLTNGSEALNFMMKSYQAEGMPLWNIKTTYLYPMENKNLFNLGSGSSNDHWSEELIITKLTDNAASGATTVTVSITEATDVTGTTANSDIIGVEMDDGTIHWTTISSGGGTTAVVLTAGIDDTAGSSNRVFAYTSRAQRPLEIIGCWAVDAATADRIEVSPLSLMEVVGQTNPTSESTNPVMYNYQQSLTNGTFRIWPRFQNGDTYLEVLAQKVFDDMDAAGNNPAFPDEWFEALVYGLAVRLAPEYKLPLQERMLLKEEAQAMKDRAWMASVEGASIKLAPAPWDNM